MCVFVELTIHSYLYHCIMVLYCKEEFILWSIRLRYNSTKMNPVVHHRNRRFQCCPRPILFNSVTGVVCPPLIREKTATRSSALRAVPLSSGAFSPSDMSNSTSTSWIAVIAALVQKTALNPAPDISSEWSDICMLGRPFSSTALYCQVIEVCIGELGRLAKSACPAIQGSGLSEAY